MIILNIEPDSYSKSAIEIWGNSEFVYHEGLWNEIDNYPDSQHVSAIIVRLDKYISNIELSFFPNLKYIISATTGLNHLDLNLIKSKGIKIFSLKGHDDFLKNIPSTAEMTWALIMTLVRRIPQANKDVLKGNWNRDEFLGTQLKNKNIGVVGLGRTGQTVAKYADVFGLNIYYYDPYQDNYNSYSKCETLETLFSISDIITFHVHLNNKTKHLLNIKNVNNLKPGCFLINTSRGEIWDENVICKALENSLIAGVATDVLANEYSDIKSNPLWELSYNKTKNIIITPHIGGATIDAMRSCEEYIAKYFIDNYKINTISI